MPKYKTDYKALKKAVQKMKIHGFTYLDEGKAIFKGRLIDLTATAPNPLAIAYTTLKTLHE